MVFGACNDGEEYWTEFRKAFKNKFGDTKQEKIELWQDFKQSVYCDDAMAFRSVRLAFKRCEDANLPEIFPLLKKFCDKTDNNCDTAEALDIVTEVTGATKNPTSSPTASPTQTACYPIWNLYASQTLCIDAVDASVLNGNAITSSAECQSACYDDGYGYAILVSEKGQFGCTCSYNCINQKYYPAATTYVQCDVVLAAA